MYTFHLIRSKRCPNIMGWYQLVTPNDGKTVEHLHQSATSKFFQDAGYDPHRDADTWHNAITNPVLMASLYMSCLEDQTLFKRNTILVNYVGGWMPLDKDCEILQTVTLDKMQYPTDIPEEFNPQKEQYKETIRITQWGDGTHFYLRSSKERIFSEHKFNTYEEAFQEAKKYVDDAHIKNIGKIQGSKYEKLRPREGD